MSTARGGTSRRTRTSKETNDVTLVGDPSADEPIVVRPRAVAYYRHSAQDRQENSIPIQREQVREWAEKNGVEIIKEFADAGKSGLNAEGRPGLHRDDGTSGSSRRDDFELRALPGRQPLGPLSGYRSVGPVQRRMQDSTASRWSTRPSAWPREGRPLPAGLHPIRAVSSRAVQQGTERQGLARLRARSPSRAIGPAAPRPTACSGCCLDERREPVHVLEPGQRKSIQNQRVTLVMGDPAEVAVIQRIFHEFVELGYSEYLIAERLNADGILSAKGHRWTAGMVVHRLQQREVRRHDRLQPDAARSSKRPADPIRPRSGCGRRRPSRGSSSPSSSLQAQEIFAERRRKYQPEEMLDATGVAARSGTGCCTRRWCGCWKTPRRRRPSPTVSAAWTMPSSSCTASRATGPGSWSTSRSASRSPRSCPTPTSWCFDQKLTVSVQPAVPIPSGYAAYWPFRPDDRQVIDITLGVLAVRPRRVRDPRLRRPATLAGRLDAPLRIGPTSSRTECSAAATWTFLQQLL